MAGNISMDPELLRDASNTMIADADALGRASRAVPESVNAGEGAEVIGDIIGEVATWAATLAEVHIAIADITRKVANETLSNEASVVETLGKIDTAIDPYA